MHIFIMRHGEAAFYAASDRERPLTARGQEQAQQQGEWLQQQGWQPDLCWSVPISVRSKHTNRFVKH